jgi:hypothetical protein
MGIHSFEGVHDFEEGKPGNAEFTQGLQGLIESGPLGAEDREKWQLLSRELAQKQEIIHRMMQEADDR